MLDYAKLENIEVEDVHPWDYPDFCDAFISHAEIDGRELSEEELDELSDDRDYVMEQVYKKLY